jgi:hypothetical protein
MVHVRDRAPARAEYAANVIPVVRGERRITVATARKADTPFGQPCMTLPPTETVPQRVSATRARRYATEQGWVPPVALEALDKDATVVDLRGVA